MLTVGDRHAATSYIAYDRGMRLSAAVVCLALVGCGDDGSNNRPPDAPRGSGDDGAVPDGPLAAQPVAITITSGGLPMHDVAVYFQKADSSLVAKVMTDATGSASQLMDAGGFVTVVDAFYNIQLARGSVRPGGNRASHDLHTWAGVKPGDHLRLSDTGFGSSTVNVTVPANAVASSISLYAAGGDPSFGAYANFVDPRTLMGTASVYGGLTTTDFLVVTADEGMGQFIYAPNTAVANDVTIPGPYVANTQATFTLTNVPDVGTVSGNTYLATPRGAIWETELAADVSSGGVMFNFTRPAPTDVTAILDSRVSTADDVAAQYFIDWKPIAAATTFDYENRTLAKFDAAHPPMCDHPTNALTWMESAGGVVPDLLVADIIVTRIAPDFLSWQWEVTAPHSAIGVAYPVLPTDAAQYNQVADDNCSIGSVRLAKVPGGYDAVRAGVLSGSFLALAGSTATGSLAYEQWVDPQPMFRALHALSPVGTLLKSSLRTALH